MKIEDMKRLKRKEIIKIAVETIKEDARIHKISNFSAGSFSKIKVMASDKTVSVDFKMPIRFLKKKDDEKLIYEVTARFTDTRKDVIYYNLKPGYFKMDNSKFFASTKESRDAIDFVLKNAKKGGVGTSDGKKFGENTTTTIEDEGRSYNVHESHYNRSENKIYACSSYYVISKKTGKILRSMHSDPNPTEIRHVSGKKPEVFMEIAE